MNSKTEITIASKGTEEIQKRKPRLQVRYVMVALLFMATFVGYASRAVLSVAITEMAGNSTNSNFPSLNWSTLGVEGYIQSSFFWGYSAAQIPSGMFVQSYGSKWPLLLAIGVSSICLIVSPVAAINGGWVAMLCVRILQGVTQASLFPALHSAIAIWTPLDERGRLATIILSGSQMGTIFTFPVAGYLIPSDGGWPSVFYVFGGMGLLWSIVWYFFGFNSPSEHPFISEEERNLIETSTSNKYETKLKAPWKEIFTSRAMWALIVAHCAENFGFWTLMAEIPTYMKFALKFEIQKNGLLSSLPYLVMAILSFVFGWMADFAFKRNWTTVAFSRKFFNTLGFWVPAAALMGLGFLPREPISLQILLLVIAVGFNAGNYAGFSLGHMDLSPNFSGIMMGITNCAANVFSTIGTLLASELIKDNKESIQNWRILYGITAAMFFFGNLFFIIFGDAARQPWNEPDYKKKEDAKQNSQRLQVKN